MSERAKLVEQMWNAYKTAAPYEEMPSAFGIMAALDVALEEAAKKCDAIENKLTEQWKAGYKVCDYTQGASDGANDCAAAIRAMKGKP